MKYEVIIFDADETLFDFKKGERFAFLNTLDKLNIKLNKEKCLKVYSEINTMIWKEFEDGHITQDKLKVERFKRFIKKMNIVADEEEFSKTYIDYLGKASFIFDNVKELLDDLKEKYRLIIITNGLEQVQKNRIGKSEIAEYFEAIIISDEIKISKPDPKIFEYALDKIGHSNKESVLMVGDSLTSDIKGGNNFNIDTCWINWNDSENNSDIKPTYEINNLLSLGNLI